MTNAALVALEKEGYVITPLEDDPKPRSPGGPTFAHHGPGVASVTVPVLVKPPSLAYVAALVKSNS